MRLVTEELVPLHSVELEMSTLGSAMYGMEHARWFRRNMPIEAFYRPSHRDIATAIHFLVDQGIEPDIQLVINRLKLVGVLGDIGGEDYLIQVADYVHSPANLRYYGGQVLEFAMKRSLEHRAREMVHAIHDGEKTIDDLLAQAFKMARNLPRIGTDTVMSGDIDIDELAERVSGIETPWPSLNMACRRSGFYFGESTVIIGHRGSGKTGALVHAMIEAKKAGHRPFYATLEMQAKEIVLRQVQSLCGLSRMPKDFVEALAWNEAKSLVKEWNIPIYDPRLMVGGDRSIDKFCSWAEDAKNNLGCDCGFIDYAQKFEAGNKRKSENRTREMDYCADQLDDMLKTTGLAGIIGSQRSIDANNKNDWRSKDSIKWEDNAALVLQLRRARGETEGKIYCSKNRHGEEPVFEVKFDGPRVRHYEEDPFA